MIRRGRVYALNLLTVTGAAFLLPYFWMVSSSLKTQDEIFRLPIEWLPPVPQWENYPTALARFPFGVYFFNSAVVALAVMVGNVFIGSLAAYGLAKFRFPFRELCFAPCSARSCFRSRSFSFPPSWLRDSSASRIHMAGSSSLWPWTPSASSSCVSISLTFPIPSSGPAGRL